MVAAILVGTLLTLVLIWLSPTVQIDVLKRTTAWFPLKNPALITMPLAFVAGIVVSLLSPDTQSAERFVEVERRMHLGV
jgi:cation/acetate symporter